MKALTTGHKYELDHFESFGLEGCPVQTLSAVRVIANPATTEK